MKCKIEKNTVQETLILPLYSRKLCTELYPNLYRDETAVRLIDQIDYDFSEAEKNSRSLMQRFGALEVAMRQNDLAFEAQAYLKNHPCAARPGSVAGVSSPESAGKGRLGRAIQNRLNTMVKLFRPGKGLDTTPYTASVNTAGGSTSPARCFSRFCISWVSLTF